MYMRAAIGLWFRRPFAEFLSYSVPPRIGGIFLTAAPFVGDGGWPSEDISLSDIGARLPEAAPIFLYHGNKDETAPFGHVDLYAKAIPQAVVRRLPGRDHQLNNDMAGVAADIRRVRRAPRRST